VSRSTLCYLVEHAFDLTAFHARDKNAHEGTPAFDPAVLLKIIVLAYSRGLASSRKIEAACREHVVFIAVSGDSQPHFTTLAAFVSELGDLAATLFAQVLVICDRQGLIGREMCALDGVKLPSRASKAKSGSRKDFQRQAEKMEQAARTMLHKPRGTDAAPQGASDVERTAKKLARLQKAARQRRDWLAKPPEERRGSRGGVQLSNRTDNESAKMATAKGVIQGYTGAAAVDETHQIIVEVQAHGTGSEQEGLMPVVEATATLRPPTTVMTADAGHHSEDNLKELAAQRVEAYICANGYRRRDARCAAQAHHQAKPDPLWDKRQKEPKPRRFGSADFRLADDGSHCTCPAGKRLYSNGSHCTFHGYAAMKFRGAERACVPCALRVQCLRTPEKTKTRQVAFFQGKREGYESHTDRMKAKIDTELGRQMMARRFATVEPACGNLRHNKRLDRFTLGGRAKVDGQGKLYGLTHNRVVP